MQSNWQEDFFRGVALEAWRRIVTPQMTSSEADFLEHALEASSDARLLDIACGNGRHAIELARRGYQMTGIDLSDEFIAEARASLSDVHWICDDMRALSSTSEFDGAYCWGNSFGYLGHDDAREFLNRVGRALKPAARFVIDTGMVAESILPSFTRNRWFRLGDLIMLSESRYDCAESRIDIDYAFVRNGQIETRPTSSYVLTIAELCRMHRDAGLSPIQLLGSTNGEPYQLGSPRLILISTKQ